MGYCKKIKIPKMIPTNTINNSYITLIFDTEYSDHYESTESSDSENSWIDLKKNL